MKLLRTSGRNVVPAVMLLAAAILLAACSTKRPPLPQANVRPTQRPYTVMGKTYEPLKSHVGFFQEGIASWYGKDFHGKKTSNGETYNMYTMTAAHKTLPLGVFVRVRNLNNGKEIVVRVNDRGPFVKSRVIDLSYAAAKALQYDAVGTAPVRIEALGYREPGSKDEYNEPDTYDTGTYAVQIGSFKDPENARRLAGEMKKLYGHADIQPAVVNGERFSRVLVGIYTSLRSAEEAEQKFSAQGYKGSFAVAVD